MCTVVGLAECTDALAIGVDLILDRPGLGLLVVDGRRAGAPAGPETMHGECCEDGDGDGSEVVSHRQAVSKTGARQRVRTGDGLVHERWGEVPDEPG